MAKKDDITPADAELKRLKLMKTVSFALRVTSIVTDELDTLLLKLTLHGKEGEIEHPLDSLIRQREAVVREKATVVDAEFQSIEQKAESKEEASTRTKERREVRSGEPITSESKAQETNISHRY